jgi:hypothetical protein
MMVLKITNFAAQYKEELIEDKLFLMLILWISAVWKYYGHFEYDAKEAKYKDDEEVFRN